MRRFFLLAWVSLAPFPALPQTCAPVEHDPITARDLAVFVPVFAQIAPDTPIAPAPGPGVRRVFHRLELAALARNYSLALAAADDLCFEWPMQVPGRERLLEAMQAALPDPGARIELLETSRYPAPRGRIEFRREDLAAPALPNAPAPVVWRGNIVFGANQRFAIWARVRVVARVSHVVAAETIRPGTPIVSGQLRLESGNAFPVSGDLASRIDQVAGRIALRLIEAGTEVRLSQPQQPPDVKRGDAVTVEVLSGSMRLAFTGKAESDGRHGDTISVRNPRSNRVFQARVEGNDKAVVRVSGPEDSTASFRN